MKFERLASSPQPLTRNKALTCALINQLAAPGLGSIFGGRLIMGSLQLTVTLAGFLMVLAWFAKLMIFYYNLASSMDATPESSFDSHWIGITGAAVFLLSWLWTLFTSFSLLSEARRKDHRSVPPPLE